MLRPNDVFVPGRFPIEKNNVYADRGKPQQDFQQAFSRGFVPLVFGSYGVGKSSLARHCVKAKDTQRKVVYIESIYGKSMADVFSRILEHIGYEVTLETISNTERESTSETNAEISGGFLIGLTAKIAGKLARRTKKALGSKRQLAVQSPTDSRILDLCEENELILILDEMHRATESFRADFSAFLKAYANRNHKKFKIAVSGTEKDASKLVIRDPGIDRLLLEVPLDPISPKESAEILVTGMNKLDLIVPENIGSYIISACVGSPFILQYVCLEISDKCYEEKRNSVSKDHFNYALSNYAKTKAQRMINSYKTAIETTGERRYRKQILHAMAHIDDDYVTMDQLVASVSKQLSTEIPSTALSGPLRDLKSPEYGSVLSDVDAPGGVLRAYNYSSFSDPAMKSVIRLIEHINQTSTDIPAELKYNN
jgi:hypothetical protein